MAPTGLTLVVVNVANLSLREDVVTVLRSNNVQPFVVDTESIASALQTVVPEGYSKCIFMTDSLHTSQHDIIRQAGFQNVLNVLLVDQERKNEYLGSQQINEFCGVLACGNRQVGPEVILNFISRHVTNDHFGIINFLRHGTKLHTLSMSSSEQREWFRDIFYRFVLELGPLVRHPSDLFAQMAVEVQDELLIRAVCNVDSSLVDAGGLQVIDLVSNEYIHVEWGFDGQALALGVRDPFGRFTNLGSSIFLDFLLTEDRKERQHIRRQAKPQDAGLLLVLERANLLSVTTAVNHATEFVALFNIADGPRNSMQMSCTLTFSTV